MVLHAHGRGRADKLVAVSGSWSLCGAHSQTSAANWDWCIHTYLDTNPSTVYLAQATKRGSEQDSTKSPVEKSSQRLFPATSLYNSKSVMFSCCVLWCQPEIMEKWLCINFVAQVENARDPYHYSILAKMTACQYFLLATKNKTSWKQLAQRFVKGIFKERNLVAYIRKFVTFSHQFLTDN